MKISLQREAKPFSKGGMRKAFLCWDRTQGHSPLPKGKLVLKEMSAELVSLFEVRYGHQTEERLVDKVSYFLSSYSSN